MGEIKNDTFALPLTTIVGEQNKGSVEPPIESFSLTSDKSFLKQLEDDKRDEKYIYAYTDSGISENGREWKPEHMMSMAKQVIEKMPVGYLGHIKPQDYGFDFPDPQIVWFGSYAEELKDKSVRLWIKGYILPTAEKLQKWIKLKAVDTISVYGKITYQMKNKIMSIQDIDLKSIDIARKLGEGLNSGIVGIYGEMTETYEELRETLQKKCCEYFRSKAYDLGIFEKPKTPSNAIGEVPTPPEPYIGCYIRKTYRDKDAVIVNVELGRECKLYEVGYEVNDDDIKIVSVDEVEEKVTYPKKKTENKSESDNNDNNSKVGEMNENKEVNEVMANVDMSQVSVDDIRNTPSLYSAIKSSIAQEMAEENNNNVLIAKAGEMDKLIGIMGEQEDYIEAVQSIIRFNAKFVGEMADAAGVDATDAEPAKIVEAVKDQKATLDAVKDVVGVEENEDVVDAVEEAVTANNEAIASKAISEVRAALDEAIKGVENEVVADYVRDDFADVVNADLSDVEDIEAWKKDALALIKDEFNGVVEKHKKKLDKIIKSSKAVGEMNAMGDLGMGSSMNPIVDNNVVDSDADVASAKALGYGDL